MPLQFLACPGLGGHQVYGLFPYDAHNGSPRCVDDHTSGGCEVNVHTTYGSERNKTIIRDVFDHEPDLVGVPGKHDPGAPARVKNSYGVTMNVHFHFIRKGRGSGLPNLLGRAFESGRTRCRNEVSQEVDRFFTHRISFRFSAECKV